MRRLIGVRKKYPAFGRGSFEVVNAHNRRVLIFMRRYQGENILCVHSLSRYAQAVEIDLAEFSGCVPIELWSEQPFPAIGDLPYLLTMGPHGFYWFRMGSKEEAERATSLATGLRKS